MSTDGWRQFGLYGADDTPDNVHGKNALGRALEDALERRIIEGGIKSPATTRRGLAARMRYLTNSPVGYAAMTAAGITAARKTIGRWKKGTQRPNPANLEKLDTAYWALRAHKVLNNLGAFKQHLYNHGAGTVVEIHPVNQAPVLPSRRRDLQMRTLTVRYVWDSAVDAMKEGDVDALKDIWDDIIAEMDSDWGAYTYVSHIGLGA
ncbi:hypothetical protein WEB32_33980 [Streptomyces netropsis]|uniref:hypothetical protein n=1 Tax=Streptomyces netropsis TaxID=55404 RepID=UPI0030CBFBDE